MTRTLTIEADEGYSVKLVTRRRVLIESPTGEHYQVDPLAGKCDCPAGYFKGNCKHVPFARRLLALLGMQDLQTELGPLAHTVYTKHR